MLATSYPPHSIADLTFGLVYLYLVSPSEVPRCFFPGSACLYGGVPRVLVQLGERFRGSSKTAGRRRMQRQRIDSGWLGSTNTIVVTREQRTAAVMLMQQVKHIIFNYKCISGDVLNWSRIISDSFTYFALFDPAHSSPLRINSIPNNKRNEDIN